MGRVELGQGHEQGGGDAGEAGAAASARAGGGWRTPAAHLQACQAARPDDCLSLLAVPLQKYIDLVAAGDPDWESHPALAAYKEEDPAQ